MKSKIISMTVLVLLFLPFCYPALASEITLTSIGQSLDTMMVKIVLKKINVAHENNNMLRAENLEGCEILVAIVGGSSKGLAVAGISREEENKRALELFQAARQKDIKVLMMHVGGKSRRDTLSDEFIRTSIPFADALILVQGANQDGLFDTLLEGKDVKIRTVPNVSSTSEPLKAVLCAWGL